LKWLPTGPGGSDNIRLADLSATCRLPYTYSFLRIQPYCRGVVKTCVVPSRRLEDRIRHVCALATVAKNDDAWLILSELRILLRQHVEHLRMVAAGKLSGSREFVERRSGPKHAQ